jgi:CRISPR/Cas system-associated protein Cas10 (large subunit of type III CRISPR-Cas system)
MIKTAQIIPEDSNEDEVGLNDRVTIYYPDDNEEETVKIVTTVRSNSLKGKVSIDSPLGKALLRHKVSDIISIKVNDTCSYDVVIRNIEKLEDDGEDERMICPWCGSEDVRLLPEEKDPEKWNDITLKPVIFPAEETWPEEGATNEN